MLSATAPIQSAQDLRDRIRELAADEPNPAVITDQLLRTMTPAEFRVAATAALHEFVRLVVARGSAAVQPLPAAAEAKTSYRTASGASTPSRKIAALRDWWERELDRHVCVAQGADREWKHLGDCSAADLLVAASSRRRKAADVEARADWLENVAKAVEHAGVPTVRELPRETLEAVLRR